MSSLIIFFGIVITTLCYCAGKYSVYTKLSTLLKDALFVQDAFQNSDFVRAHEQLFTFSRKKQRRGGVE